MQTRVLKYCTLTIYLYFLLILTTGIVLCSRVYVTCTSGSNEGKLVEAKKKEKYLYPLADIYGSRVSKPLIIVTLFTVTAGRPLALSSPRCYQRPPPPSLP